MYSLAPGEFLKQHDLVLCTHERKHCLSWRNAFGNAGENAVSYARGGQASPDGQRLLSRCRACWRGFNDLYVRAIESHFWLSLPRLMTTQ